MDHTKNYNLPQWVKSDRVRMEDFNDAMASIEAGLTSAAGKADAAQASADGAFSASFMPFAVGSYTGDGGNQIVRVGFEPSFVIISGMRTSRTEGSYDTFDRYFAMTTDNENVRNRVQIIASGFIVYPDNNSGAFYPTLNQKGRHYDYIAFR